MFSQRDEGPKTTNKKCKSRLLVSWPEERNMILKEFIKRCSYSYPYRNILTGIESWAINSGLCYHHVYISWGLFIQYYILLRVSLGKISKVHVFHGDVSI